METWNSGIDFIFYGKDSELTGEGREDQEISMLSMHLLQSVEEVLGAGVEVERQVADVLAAVGDERDVLVGLHAMGGEHLEQAAFGLGVGKSSTTS